MCDSPLDGAFTCGGGEGGAVPGPTDSMACNQCIEGCCSTTYCACYGDSGQDDAGIPTGCLAYVACIQTCLQPAADSGAEAGTPTTCATQCMSFGNTQQQGEGNALLQCVIAACATAPDTSCAQ
jgi:hypothetical protein